MLARTRLGLAVARRGLPEPVVLVPTMGALHEGHRALLRRARELAGQEGCVVATVFVNPLQFGAGEDFGRYPRTLDADVALCGQEGVSLVFAPDASQMYPDPGPGGEPPPAPGGRPRLQMITVDPGPMGQVLEGASRPGFFTGVLTVVLKIFSLVRPHTAVFGRKDAQQLALVERMAREFDLGVRIVGVPTVRDGDGLAVSSRNRYLSAAERATALALYRALRAGSEAGRDGPEAVLDAARRVLSAAEQEAPPLALDYLELVDPGTFRPVAKGWAGGALLLVAARVGATRLIDNVSVTIGD